MIVAGPDFRPPPTITMEAVLTLVLAIVCAISALAIDPNATITLTSWWRSTQRNQEVGGVANSFHLTARAIDITVKPSGLKNIIQLGQTAGLLVQSIAIMWRKFGFQAVIEDDHVHLELDPIR